MNERRMFARIKIKIPLKFLIPTNGREGEAETVDISANGIGLITKESLDPKTPLEMWLDIPDHHEPLHIIGEVIWSRDLDDKTLKRVGVLLEEERLMGLARVLLFKENNPDNLDKIENIRYTL